MRHLLLSYLAMWLALGPAHAATDCDLLLGYLKDDPRFAAKMAMAEENTDWLLGYGIPQEEVDLLASRATLLPLVSDGTTRDAAREVARAELRARSDRLKRALKAGGPPEARMVDDLIIGAGVHGIIADESARDGGRTTLTVEAGDDIGSVFRAFGDGLLMNSRGRREQWATPRENQVAKPGQGNLNSIPGARIQTVDMTGAQYPTGTDLADALLFEYHASQPNLVMGVRPVKYELREKTSGTSGWPVTARLRVTLSDGSTVFVRNNVHIALGLGPEGLPFQPSSRPEQLFTRIRKQDAEGGQPQRLWYGGEFLRENASSKGATVAAMRGKRVVIVGGGDQAKVILENLVRDSVLFQRPGASPMQSGGPVEIVALGLDANTCKEYLDQARARYSRLSGNLQRKDGREDDAIRRIVNPINGLATGFDFNGEFKILVGPKQTQKDLPPGVQPPGPPGADSVSGDIVIFATGPKGGGAPDLNLLANQIGDNVSAATAVDVTGQLTGYRNPVKLGKQLALDGERLPFYFWGAGKKLAEKGETDGIKENIDSIFATARRTAAGVHQVSPPVADRLNPLAEPEKPALFPVNGTRKDFALMPPPPKLERPPPDRIDYSRPVFLPQERKPTDMLVLEDVVLQTRVRSLLETEFRLSDYKTLELRWIRLEGENPDGSPRFALTSEPPLLGTEQEKLAAVLGRDREVAFALQAFIGPKAKDSQLAIQFTFRDGKIVDSSFETNGLPVPKLTDIRGPGALQRYLSDVSAAEATKLTDLLPVLAAKGAADPVLVKRFVQGPSAKFKREGLRALARVEDAGERARLLGRALNDRDVEIQRESIQLIAKEEPSADLLVHVIAARRSTDEQVRTAAQALLDDKYRPLFLEAEKTILSAIKRKLGQASATVEKAAKSSLDVFRDFCDPTRGVAVGETRSEKALNATAQLGFCAFAIVLAGVAADIVYTQTTQKEPILGGRLVDAFFNWTGGGQAFSKVFIANSSASPCARPDDSNSRGGLPYKDACAKAGGSNYPCECACSPKPVAINPWSQICLR